MAEYLTVAEAADLYRVSTKTIRRWVESGRIDAVKIDRTIRIPRPLSDPPEKVSA